MKQRDATAWVTARIITVRTGLTYRQLEAMRKVNRTNGFYKLSPTGGYVYNMSMIPKELLKTTAI